MVKITLRRACLAAAAFVLSVFALLTLCFTVVKVDFAHALGEFSGALGEYRAFSAASENGFDMLDGNSDIILFFNTVLMSAAETAGITYLPSNFTALTMFAQIFNILMLICVAFMCAGTVLWLFFGKSERAVQTIALVAVWVSVVYFIEGLLFSIVLNAAWKDFLNTAFPSSSLFFRSAFSTQAFIPLILTVVAEITYWCLRYRLKEGQENEQNEEKNLQEEANQDRQEMLYRQLKRLKELYDEGVLTEQEYGEEKTKLLSQQK